MAERMGYHLWVRRGKDVLGLDALSDTERDAVLDHANELTEVLDLVDCPMHRPGFYHLTILQVYGHMAPSVRCCCWRLELLYTIASSLTYRRFTLQTPRETRPPSKEQQAAFLEQHIQALYEMIVGAGLLRSDFEAPKH